MAALDAQHRYCLRLIIKQHFPIEWLWFNAPDPQYGVQLRLPHDPHSPLPAIWYLDDHLTQLQTVRTAVHL